MQYLTFTTWHLKLAKEIFAFNRSPSFRSHLGKKPVDKDHLPIFILLILLKEDYDLSILRKYWGGSEKDTIYELFYFVWPPQFQILKEFCDNTIDQFKDLKGYINICNRLKQDAVAFTLYSNDDAPYLAYINNICFSSSYLVVGSIAWSISYNILKLEYCNYEFAILIFKNSSKEILPLSLYSSYCNFGSEIFTSFLKVVFSPEIFKKLKNENK